MKTPRPDVTGGRVLLLHAGALGDCALTLHVVRAIRASRPAARITLAARSGLARWAQQHQLIHGGLDLDQVDAWGLDERGGPSATCRDQLAPFDLVISFLGGEAEPVARRLSAAATGLVVHVDPRPDQTTTSTGRHIVIQWIDSLRGAGVGLATCDPPAARLVEPTGPTLIHPGSGGLAKCCPLAAWVAVVRRLRNDGRDVAWMLGPAELERFSDEAMAELRHHAPIRCEEDIVRAADLAASAEIYLGHDAGMTHVAALAGAPTVAVFGPTNSRTWRPIGLLVGVDAFPTGEDWQGFAERLLATAARLRVTGGGP